ncbi:MAG: GAF domain-containing protein [Anaerolineales bacterium]|nr:GAF domain-containing protein [Anaerolineales bacterium]
MTDLPALDSSALPTGKQFTPEMLVNRLGEYLLESGVIKPAQLQQALDYQKELAPERHVLLGQALLELGLIDRDTLDQAVTRQLLALQSALMEANRGLEERVQQRTMDLEHRLVQIRTAADITQLAISASSLNELLRRAVDLIVERFSYYLASIFLVDEAGEVATLSEASGALGRDLMAKGVKIMAGSRSIIGWVLAHRKVRVAAEVGDDYFYLQDERLSTTRSEVCIPLLVGDKLLGVLDVQHSVENAFDPDAIAVLQVVANHIASVIQNFRLLQTTQASLNELSSLYYASYQLARAEKIEDITMVVSTILEGVPYFAMFLLPERTMMRVVTVHEPGLPEWGMAGKPRIYPDTLDINPLELDNIFHSSEGRTGQFLQEGAVEGELYWVVESLANSEKAVVIPEALMTIMRQADIRSLALIPSRRSGKLDTLLVLGGLHEGGFAQNVLQANASLAELAATAMEKVRASQRMEKQMGALSTLNTISQAVSVETDLNSLYQVIHREVVEVMGSVNFAIAIYDQEKDTITVPYMYDLQEVRSVPAFPLGEGLTSIIIRTRKPLMLVEDTERKTMELGAKLVGKPAKSWLGVPLLVAGEVLGAILVQDLNQEGRFDEDDMRLMETLASQVAVAVRNARLLESTYRQAERERLLFDITNRVRTSPDIPRILEATTRELSRALGARRATIKLGTDIVTPLVQAVSLPEEKLVAEEEKGNALPLTQPPPQSGSESDGKEGEEEQA